MSFDEIFDLTAGVYFFFPCYVGYQVSTTAVGTEWYDERTEMHRRHYYSFSRVWRERLGSWKIRDSFSRISSSYTCISSYYNRTAVGFQKLPCRTYQTPVYATEYLCVIMWLWNPADADNGIIRSAMLNAPHVVHTCSTFSSSPGWITIYINTVLIVEFWEHDVRTSVGFAVIESEHDQWTPLVSVVGTSVRGTSVRGTRYEVPGIVHRTIVLMFQRGRPRIMQNSW